MYGEGGPCTKGGKKKGNPLISREKRHGPGMDEVVCATNGGGPFRSLL